MRTDIRPAEGLILSVMKITDVDGLFWVNDRIYLRYDIEYGPGELAALESHEQCHYRQRLRHGWLMFWLLTFYYVIRYGYNQSPFEIEARTAAQSTYDYYRASMRQELR